MSFRTAEVSKIGGRDRQQDHCGFALEGERVLWVVADGLGGQEGGERASRLAVEAALASFRRAPSLDRSSVATHLEAANAAVLAGRAADPSASRMSSTIVLLAADERHAFWGHVGDSRLYHFRERRVRAQTRDHSVPQRMADVGEIPASAIRHHEDRSRLLRTLGKGAELRSTVTEEPTALVSGDAFLLCSDGFWEHVTEPDMEADLAASRRPEDWLAAMEGRLLGCVDGDHDNYTAIAVRVGDEGAAQSP